MFFCALLLRHIVDRQQHGHGPLLPRRPNAARIEAHAFAPDPGKIMVHREILELRILGAEGLE